MKNKTILIIISSLIISSNSIASDKAVKLDVLLKDVYGQSSMAVYINCVSSVYIENRTSLSKRYTLGTRICAENKGCFVVENSLWIQPGKTYTTSYNTVFSPVFGRSGTRTIDCTNYVNGGIDASLTKYAKAYIS